MLWLPEEGGDLLGRVIHEVLADEVLGGLLQAIAVLPKDLQQHKHKHNHGMAWQTNSQIIKKIRNK